MRSNEGCVVFLVEYAFAHLSTWGASECQYQRVRSNPKPLCKSREVRYRPLLSQFEACLNAFSYLDGLFVDFKRPPFKQMKSDFRVQLLECHMYRNVRQSATLKPAQSPQ